MVNKKNEILTPSELCRRGQWKRVSHWMKDTAWMRLSLEERSWCLYALYFSGAWAEAESWRLMWQPEWNLRTQAHVFFARCIAMARSGQLQQARLEWLKNWQQSSLRKTNASDNSETDKTNPFHSSAQPLLAKARGWMFQAQSFIQMQRTRWPSAGTWAALAERESVYCSDHMLRSMASDMQAHASVKQGFYSRAIYHAQQAFHCARLLENRGIENAIRVSLACWRSERGENPQRSLRTLRSLLTEKSFHDNYSQVVLLLEIARSLMIQGKFELARKSLTRAEKSMSGMGSRPLFRQKIALAQRKALLARLEGRPLVALSELELVVNDIPDFESSLRLEVRGQMISACKEAKMIPPKDWLEEERKLTFALRTPHALRFLKRRLELSSLSAELSDPLGELVDSLQFKENSIAPPIECIARGFPGLLALKIQRSCDHMLIILPGRSKILLITPAGVDVCEEPASSQIITLARNISMRICHKENIVRNIWGRRYFPDRDDPGIYVLVRRLRRLLGNHSDLIESRQGGYFLNASVFEWPTHLSLSFTEPETISKAFKNTTERQTINSTPLSSLRVLKLREWIQERPYFTAQDWQKEVEISRASACRDVAELVALNLIKKVGRGPASVYVPVNKVSSEALHGG